MIIPAMKIIGANSTLHDPVHEPKEPFPALDLPVDEMFPHSECDEMFSSIEPSLSDFGISDDDGNNDDDLPNNYEDEYEDFLYDVALMLN